MNLPRLLATVADVYDDLLDASLPSRSTEPTGTGGRDPLDRPAPGNLTVLEHRHKLVRGLRWWVDAVRETGPPVGHDVRRMVRVLHAHLPVMAAEDTRELAANLTDWLTAAEDHLGAPDTPVPLDLPAAAYDQTVRVADAARVLGCTVRTIQRRVPAEQRPGGMVRLGDAARCGHCDLPAGQCGCALSR